MALNQEKAGKSTKMSFKTADKIMIKMIRKCKQSKEAIN